MTVINIVIEVVKLKHLGPKTVLWQVKFLESLELLVPLASWILMIEASIKFVMAARLIKGEEPLPLSVKLRIALNNFPYTTWMFVCIAYAVLNCRYSYNG